MKCSIILLSAGSSMRLVSGSIRVAPRDVLRGASLAKTARVESVPPSTMLLSPTARASFIDDILSSTAKSSAMPLLDQLLGSETTATALDSLYGLVVHVLSVADTVGRLVIYYPNAIAVRVSLET